MNKLQTTQILSIFKSNYQHSYKNLSNDDVDNLINLWTGLLKDYDFNIIMQAVNNLLSTHSFPPVIADILKEYNNLTNLKIERKKESALEKLERERAEEERENAELLAYYDDLSEESKIKVESMVDEEINANRYLKGLSQVARLICIKKYRGIG